MRGRFGWQWWRAGCAARGASIAALLAFSSLGARPLSAQPLSAAEQSKLRIGFSNLVARLDTDEIGIAKAEYRVHILEALRSGGFNAVGAESLVFNRDDAERADLVLGGTVRELHCRNVKRKLNCRIGVEWELLDRSNDTIVYRVLTRHMEPAVERNNNAMVGRKLALGALHDLMQRARFAALVDRKRENLEDEERYAAAGFRACQAPERKLPEQFAQAADATFLIKQAGGFGSGFSISPDGLVLTAAHVVSERGVELIPRGGAGTLTGNVVRVSRKHDVALIAIANIQGDQPCLALRDTPPEAGKDVYAIGTPATQDLAFSLTRGIVSGLRLLDGVQLVQTDASLNPGNSGGPLLDDSAHVVGVVTRKIAGEAVEGLGFGVDIQDALQALQLRPDRLSDAGLFRVAPLKRKTALADDVDDAETPLPSLDPEGDRQRALATDLARRERERSEATPGYVKPLRWVGLAACLGGLVGIAYSTGAANQAHITHANYAHYRAQNDWSWAVFGVGTVGFALSFPLEPSLAPAKEPTR